MIHTGQNVFLILADLSWKAIVQGQSLDWARNVEKSSATGSWLLDSGVEFGQLLSFLLYHAQICDFSLVQLESTPDAAKKSQISRSSATG
jgi:hypothetical protein